MNPTRYRFAIATLVVACGGSSTAIQVSDLGHDYSDAVCEKIFACCSSAEIMAQFFGAQQITTQSECEEAFASFGSIFDPSSVGSNAVTYDASAARACIDGINALACGDVQWNDTMFIDTSMVPACATVIAPRLANGSQCAADYECTSNACFGALDPNGTCMPLPSEGQRCYDTCASGLYCSGASSVDGQYGTCATLLANGSACVADFDCASGYCGSGSACATRTSCTGSGAGG
jgi:hypothetical protein